MIGRIVQYIFVEVPLGSARIREGSIRRSYLDLMEWKLGNAREAGK